MIDARIMEFYSVGWDLQELVAVQGAIPGHVNQRR